MVFQNHFRSQAILLDQLFYNSRNLILITLPEFSEERPVVLIGFTGQLGPAYSAGGNQGVWRKWTNHNVCVGRGLCIRINVVGNIYSLINNIRRSRLVLRTGRLEEQMPNLPR